MYARHSLEDRGMTRRSPRQDPRSGNDSSARTMTSPLRRGSCSSSRGGELYRLTVHPDASCGSRTVSPLYALTVELLKSVVMKRTIKIPSRHLRANVHWIRVSCVSLNSLRKSSRGNNADEFVDARYPGGMNRFHGVCRNCNERMICRGTREQYNEELQFRAFI